MSAGSIQRTKFNSSIRTGDRDDRMKMAESQGRLSATEIVASNRSRADRTPAT
ncbi:hypothetical protein [Chamaesiphon sp. VAR_48_metabat_403]|uniref:hypothetical protein n=1 Tax=Chamaesiphon sp. VAR_48_metabat_403 TaxID=2964700 RepID=UPI00286E02FA|nr:hypothetical protein [Chamaesiphon sp. VAR_48_metabat_403]